MPRSRTDFLTCERDPKLAVVDWDYNAWGNKYPPFDLDEVIPTRIAEILKLSVFYPRMILEGGSIDVNGTGALLTSESCLLNKNRNPNLSRMKSSNVCGIISGSATFSGSETVLLATTQTATSTISRGLSPSAPW